MPRNKPSFFWPAYILTVLVSPLFTHIAGFYIYFWQHEYLRVAEEYLIWPIVMGPIIYGYFIFPFCALFFDLWQPQGLPSLTGKAAMFGLIIGLLSGLFFHRAGEQFLPTIVMICVFLSSLAAVIYHWLIILAEHVHKTPADKILPPPQHSDG